MRYLMALLLVAASVPLAQAAGAKGECQKRCKLEYKQCRKQSTSAAAKNTCSIRRRTCNLGCRGR
jgi:hypothetical protein